jgi:hypothetical protein
MDTISNTARAAAQSTIGSTTFSNQKVADLQNDISEPSKKQRLTTDYGINIADTDNWYVFRMNRGRYSTKVPF